MLFYSIVFAYIYYSYKCISSNLYFTNKDVIRTTKLLMFLIFVSFQSITLNMFFSVNSVFIYCLAGAADPYCTNNVIVNILLVVLMLVYIGGLLTLIIISNVNQMCFQENIGLMKVNIYCWFLFYKILYYFVFNIGLNVTMSTWMCLINAVFVCKNLLTKINDRKPNDDMFETVFLLFDIFLVNISILVINQEMIGLIFNNQIYIIIFGVSVLLETMIVSKISKNNNLLIISAFDRTNYGKVITCIENLIRIESFGKYNEKYSIYNMLVRRVNDFLKEKSNTESLNLLDMYLPETFFKENIKKTAERILSDCLKNTIMNYFNIVMTIMEQCNPEILFQLNILRCQFLCFKLNKYDCSLIYFYCNFVKSPRTVTEKFQIYQLRMIYQNWIYKSNTHSAIYPNNLINFFIFEKICCNCNENSLSLLNNFELLYNELIKFDVKHSNIDDFIRLITRNYFDLKNQIQHLMNLNMFPKIIINQVREIIYRIVNDKEYYHELKVLIENKSEMPKLNLTTYEGVKSSIEINRSHCLMVLNQVGENIHIYYSSEETMKYLSYCDKEMLNMNVKQILPFFDNNFINVRIGKENDYFNIKNSSNEQGFLIDKFGFLNIFARKICLFNDLYNSLKFVYIGTEIQINTTDKEAYLLLDSSSYKIMGVFKSFSTFLNLTNPINFNQNLGEMSQIQLFDMFPQLNGDIISNIISGKISKHVFEINKSVVSKLENPIQNISIQDENREAKFYQRNDNDNISSTTLFENNSVETVEMYMEKMIESYSQNFCLMKIAKLDKKKSLKKLTKDFSKSVSLTTQVKPKVFVKFDRYNRSAFNKIWKMIYMFLICLSIILVSFSCLYYLNYNFLTQYFTLNNSKISNLIEQISIVVETMMELIRISDKCSKGPSFNLNESLDYDLAKSNRVNLLINQMNDISSQYLLFMNSVFQFYYTTDLAQITSLSSTEIINIKFPIVIKGSSSLVSISEIMLKYVDLLQNIDLATINSTLATYSDIFAVVLKKINGLFTFDNSMYLNLSNNLSQIINILIIDIVITLLIFVGFIFFRMFTIKRFYKPYFLILKLSEIDINSRIRIIREIREALYDFKINLGENQTKKLTENEFIESQEEILGDTEEELLNSDVEARLVMKEKITKSKEGSNSTKKKKTTKTFINYRSQIFWSTFLVIIILGLKLVIYYFFHNFNSNISESINLTKSQFLFNFKFIQIDFFSNFNQYLSKSNYVNTEEYQEMISQMFFSKNALESVNYLPINYGLIDFYNYYSAYQYDLCGDLIQSFITEMDLNDYCGNNSIYINGMSVLQEQALMDLGFIFNGTISVCDNLDKYHTTTNIIVLKNGLSQLAISTQKSQFARMIKFVLLIYICSTLIQFALFLQLFINLISWSKLKINENQMIFNLLMVNKSEDFRFFRYSLKRLNLIVSDKKII